MRATQKHYVSLPPVDTKKDPGQLTRASFAHIRTNADEFHTPK